MKSVALLRAVNVGGARLSTKAFAAELGLHSVGAAGTFVGVGTPAELATKVTAALPFETGVVTFSMASLQAALAPGHAFDVAAPDGAVAAVAFLEHTLPADAVLPLCVPDATRWDVRLVARDGLFVLAQRYPGGPAKHYPSAVIKRNFGVNATTRTWATLQKIAKLA